MLAFGTGVAFMENPWKPFRGVGRTKAPPRFRAHSFREMTEIGRGQEIAVKKPLQKTTKNQTVPIHHWNIAARSSLLREAN